MGGTGYELAAENTRLESLESENMDLRKQIEAQSASATQSAAERIVKENEAAAGGTAVEGEGIVMPGIAVQLVDRAVDQIVDELQRIGSGAPAPWSV